MDIFIKEKDKDSKLVEKVKAVHQKSNKFVVEYMNGKIKEYDNNRYNIKYILD